LEFHPRANLGAEFRLLAVCVVKEQIVATNPMCLLRIEQDQCAPAQQHFRALVGGEGIWTIQVGPSVNERPGSCVQILKLLHKLRGLLPAYRRAAPTQTCPDAGAALLKKRFRGLREG